MTRSSVMKRAEYCALDLSLQAVESRAVLSSQRQKAILGIKRPIRVLIGDNHPMVREGLNTILTRAKDFEVVGQAKDGEEVCCLYDELSPDILLLDLRLPQKDGFEVIAELMTRIPKPMIIVVTSYQTTEKIRRAFAAGVSGYVLKEIEGAELCDTIWRVFRGEFVASPVVASKLVESLARPGLKERELEILQSLCEGKSNKEMAHQHYLSESAIKQYLKSLFRKLGANGRTDAVAIAAKRGLVETIG
jgi:two-component system, NarL family, response regulator